MDVRGHAYVCAYTWRSEDDVECLPQSFPTLFFETESHIEPGIYHLFILAGQCLPRILSPLLGCICTDTPIVCLSSGDRSSGPHACMTSSLATESPLQSIIQLLSPLHGLYEQQFVTLC